MAYRLLVSGPVCLGLHGFSVVATIVTLGHFQVGTLRAAKNTTITKLVAATVKGWTLSGLSFL